MLTPQILKPEVLGSWQQVIWIPAANVPRLNTAAAWNVARLTPKFTAAEIFKRPSILHILYFPPHSLQGERDILFSMTDLKHSIDWGLFYTHNFWFIKRRSSSETDSRYYTSPHLICLQNGVKLWALGILKLWKQIRHTNSMTNFYYYVICIVLEHFTNKKNAVY